MGQTQQFTLTWEGEQPSPAVEWTLEPANGVASVDQNGLLTALSPGTTTLRAGGLTASITVVEPSPPPLDPPTFDMAATGIEEVDGNIVVRVKANGDSLYSLEVDHNAEAHLPEFTIYASPAPLWGTPEEEAQASDLGVEASYEDGLWTITLLDGGAAKAAFMEHYDGVVRFHLVVANTEGGTTGSMDNGESLTLELTIGT